MCTEVYKGEEGRGGCEGAKKAGRENNNDKGLWKDCSEKKCVRLFTSGDAWLLHLFTGSSPAERLLSSQHCNKATTMALFVCMECSCMGTSNRLLHQGWEHCISLCQRSSEKEKQCTVVTTELTSTSYYLTTKSCSLLKCHFMTLFDALKFMKTLTRRFYCSLFSYNSCWLGYQAFSFEPLVVYSVLHISQSLSIPLHTPAQEDGGGGHRASLSAPSALCSPFNLMTKDRSASTLSYQKLSLVLLK